MCLINTFKEDKKNTSLSDEGISYIYHQDDQLNQEERRSIF